MPWDLARTAQLTAKQEICSRRMACPSCSTPAVLLPGDSVNLDSQQHCITSCNAYEDCPEGRVPGAALGDGDGDIDNGV